MYIKFRKMFRFRFPCHHSPILFRFFYSTKSPRVVLPTAYLKEHARSLADPNGFWSYQAQSLPWFKSPGTQVLGKDTNGYEEWFKGGLLNAAWIATDHQASIRPKQLALIYDSPKLGLKQTLTYEELAREVGRVGYILKSKFGVNKGDRVLIYMPMMLESVIVMLACARIGAIHSVVFGGFAANEVAFRMKDLNPKIIVSATGSIEVDRLTDYGAILDNAFTLPDYLDGNPNRSPLPVLFIDRPALRKKFPGILKSPSAWNSNYFNYYDLLAKTAQSAPVCETEATDILYILYTSGTTGKPKGIVRDHGSAVALKYAMDKIMDAKPGTTYFAASDIGWVVGHSFSVYGPLIQGCTSVIFEGKPIKYPDAGVFWRIIEEYGVTTMFGAPTAFRAIRKEDPQAVLLHRVCLLIFDNRYCR